MINPKITVYLDDDERQILFKLANAEKRDPRQQAAYMIRQWLESAGYLKPAVLPEPPNVAEAANVTD